MLDKCSREPTFYSRQPKLSLRFTRHLMAIFFDQRQVRSINVIESRMHLHRGHLGSDTAPGIEYQAVVEFAPVQKTPHKAKSKADTRQRTIEDGGSKVLSIIAYVFQIQTSNRTWTVSQLP